MIRIADIIWKEKTQNNNPYVHKKYWVSSPECVEIYQRSMNCYTINILKNELVYMANTFNEAKDVALMAVKQ
ncbi:MAG TPA: hypothetical protein VHM20_07725 [Gammaproteobacteria bacterium]|jgi:hypothetical protein|nr:hypothetical protein [Gammaproteobacteria bacterium]